MILNAGVTDQRPPTTTVVSGRCAWLPMAMGIAAGKWSMPADIAVISIGRISLGDGTEHRFGGIHAHGMDLIAGQCAMPECRVELFANSTEYNPIVGRYRSGIMGDIARNRHTAGFAHILADSLPAASRIAHPMCMRRYPGTHELAPLGSVSGLVLALRGL
jgi:hypothetical protein